MGGGVGGEGKGEVARVRLIKKELNFNPHKAS